MGEIGDGLEVAKKEGAWRLNHLGPVHGLLPVVEGTFYFRPRPQPEKNLRVPSRIDHWHVPTIFSLTSSFRSMEPGRPARDVLNEVREESRGLPFRMPHVGDGIGISLHEFPILGPGNDTKLQAGMVLNIEPMVVLEERREACHTEDLAEVTDQGAQPPDTLRNRSL